MVRKPDQIVVKLGHLQKVTRFSGHLLQWSAFWARTFGHGIVTIVTWSTNDQVFWPFTTMISILSSNFCSRNCYDRDMTKNWPGFLVIYYNDLHFEVELLVPKLLRSWLANRTSVRQHHITVSPRHPSLACSETKRGATCPVGVF